MRRPGLRSNSSSSFSRNYNGTVSCTGRCAQSTGVYADKRRRMSRARTMLPRCAAWNGCAVQCRYSRPHLLGAQPLGDIADYGDGLQESVSHVVRARATRHLPPHGMQKAQARRIGNNPVGMVPHNVPDGIVLGWQHSTRMDGAEMPRASGEQHMR